MKNKIYYRWMATGALITGLYVALGAFGAHGLEGHLDVKSMATYQTALRYMVIHSLGLIVVNGLSRNDNDSIKAYNWLVVGGLLLFSCSLLIHACKDLLGIEINVFAMLAPVGGLSFIAAWLVLGFKWLRK